MKLAIIITPRASSSDKLQDQISYQLASYGDMLDTEEVTNYMVNSCGEGSFLLCKINTESLK